MSTDGPDDGDCVSLCSDDSNASSVHYQDAVEHWWKQSGGGVKHSDLNDIPPRVVNDDDSLDDDEELLELPPDIVDMNKEALCKAIDEDLIKYTSEPSRETAVGMTEQEKQKQDKNINRKTRNEFDQGVVSSDIVEQPSGCHVAMPATAYNLIGRYLLDTGAPMDLVSSTTCDRALEAGWKLNKSMATWKFSIANGPKEANEVLPVFIKELGTTTYPLRMGKCPDVLSVGLRTMSRKADRWSCGWMFSYDPF